MRSTVRRRSRILVLPGCLAAAFVLAPRALSAQPTEVVVHPGDPLQSLLDTLRGPVTVRLTPGRYDLAPVHFTDPSCGNCRDPGEHVPATRGLLIQGRGVTLRGAGADSVRIHTHAGYGILFDGCDGCVLTGVTVTDGERDPDGRATDAGVVIRRGHVALSDCAVENNLGDSAVVHTVVVGVAGVGVREEGGLELTRCRIVRNSWDGVALYRGAHAVIRDNLIDGVDRASGGRMGGGRGVGIGLTWNARATVEGNHVTRYWKGIGVFVDARARVTENVVEDVLTWGLAYWAAGGGHPVAEIADNVVFRTGACGVIVDGATAAPDDPGSLEGNIFVRTGQDPRYDPGEPYCAQRPIARHAVPAGFHVADNLIFDVRQPGDAPREPVLDEAGFRAAAAPLVARLRARPALRDARFLLFYDGLGRGTR